MFENIQMKNVIIVLAIIAAIVYYIYTPKRINVPQPIYKAPVGPAQPVPVRTVVPTQAPLFTPAKAQIVTQQNPPVQTPQLPEQSTPQQTQQQTATPMSDNPDNSMLQSQYVKNHLKSSSQHRVMSGLSGNY